MKSVFFFDQRTPMVVEILDESPTGAVSAHVVNGDYYISYNPATRKLEGFARPHFRDKRTEAEIRMFRRVDVPKQHERRDYRTLIALAQAGEFAMVGRA